MSGSNGSGAPPPPPSARAGLGSTPLPPPVRPASEPPPPERHFVLDGQEWIARVSGQCAYGTGRSGTASLLSIDFAPASEPERAMRRALLPRGRFFTLFDAELRGLFERARPISAAEDASAG